MISFLRQTHRFTKTISKKEVNAFRERVTEYPGRIFTFNDPETDRAELSEVFTRYSQLYCEIGSGAGNHLVELAARNPQACCLGFEVRFKRAVRTIEKSDNCGIGNVFVIRGDWHTYSAMLPARAVSGVFVNFPDPWKKPRQQKHQILSATLLEKLGGLLESGGFVSVKTDDKAYFQKFLKVTETQDAYKLVECSDDLAHSDYAAANITTEFEQMFKADGAAICYCKLSFERSRTT